MVAKLYLGSPQPVRVALLNCEKLDHPALQELCGPFFSEMFIRKFQKAIEKSQPAPEVEWSAWDVINGQFPDPTSVDAIIVSGGAASAYDTTPWVIRLGGWIADTYQNHPHVKMVGICLGHQVISRALLSQYGTTVEKNPRGFQFGVRPIELDPRFCAHFPSLGQRYQTLKIQVMHGDHVNSSRSILPPDWIRVGKTDCCDVHGYFQPNRILTLQGHFEFDSISSAAITKAVFTLEKGWSLEAITAALERIEGPDDGDVYADFLLSFLTGTQVGNHQVQPAPREIAQPVLNEVFLPLLDKAAPIVSTVA